MVLKIGITRREYVTNLDGVNRFLFTLADGLSVLGHEVYVISHSFRGCPYSELFRYLKNYFDIERNYKIYMLSPSGGSESWPKIALSWFLNGSRLINQLDLDVVIVNGVVPLNTKSIKIAVCHGFQAGIFPKLRGLKRQLYFRFVKYIYRYNTDAVICVSPQLKKEFRELIGIDSLGVPLPLKCHLFNGNRERNNLIIHIGTRPGKNVEISIKTLKILVEKMHVNAKLVIIGPWNMYIEGLASKYRKMIPEHLSFVFEGDPPTVRKFLAEGKVLILPSRYEAFSYVVLEAFASGLPVVVSKAIPEELVVDGFNGFRVSSFEPKDYAAKLSALFESVDLWEEMSRAARVTAEKYSYINIAKQYETIIRCFL
ncbi:MAG: glycosyltransferase family 4 protein [Candidatus Bathyarchaeales archaeon]